MQVKKKERIDLKEKFSYNLQTIRNVRWSLLSLFALFDLPSSLQNRLLHLICSIDDNELITG